MNETPKQSVRLWKSIAIAAIAVALIACGTVIGLLIPPARDVAISPVPETAADAADIMETAASSDTTSSSIQETKPKATQDDDLSQIGELDYSPDYTLLSTTELPAALAERRLSDEQVATLKKAPLEELAEAISTYADYLAWIRTQPESLFYCDLMSNGDQQITLDGQYCYNYLNQIISGSQAVGLAQRILEEDYPGMRIVILVTECSTGRTVTYGNAFPDGNGYDVLSTFPFVSTPFGYFDVFRPIYLEDFHAVAKYAEGSDITWGWGDEITQVMILDTDQGMVFDFDADRCVYVLSKEAFTSGEITTVYRRGTVETPAATAEIDFSSLGTYKRLDPGALPDELAPRTLSDADVNALKDAGEETLRERISTFGDYVAWLGLQQADYYTNIFSGDNWLLNLDPSFNFEWKDQMIGGKMNASMAMGFLQDDLPDMKFALLVTASGQDLAASAANVFPAPEGGYYVLAAESFLPGTPDYADVISPLWVSDLSALVAYGAGDDLAFGAEGTLAQVLVFDSVDGVTVSAPSGLYRTDRTMPVTEVYLNEAAGSIKKKPTLRMSAFGFPDAVSLETGIDEAAAKKIREGSLEEAAASLNSIADVISYMYYAFDPNMAGDICYYVPDSDLQWHFNYKPEITFLRDVSSCGAVSGLVAYLLDGDYEDSGIINMTYAEGMGGGHVINYFKTNGVYCTVDFNGYTTFGFQARMLGVYFADNLDDAVRAYTGNAGGVKIAYTYHSVRGDDPVGWDTSHATRLIRDYVDDVHVVFETPEEGYSLIIVDADDETREKIEYMRNR